MGNMRFKVGDRVRIKSLDWYHENKTVHGDVWFDNAVFVGGQSLYCGCELTIRLVTDDHYYVIENDYYWIDEMIEELVEEETKPKFKVGDKITNGNVTLTILTLSSDRYVVEDNFGECGTLYFNSQDGWKIVEEESEKKLSDESWRYKNIFDPSQYPQSFECPEGYIFKDENGNVINATKIVLEKRKKEYPKTYLECCDILGIQDIISQGVNGYLKDKLEALQKLLICRDVYWKIAGEEMGLGKPWKPDYTNPNKKRFAIHSYVVRGEDGVYRLIPVYYKIGERQDTLGERYILEFPTEEMRDAFYENFKELIEMCKELL